MAFRKRKGKAPLSPWSDQTKVTVVTQYLALGKAPLVEALTGVPRQTIRLWKTQPWWGELVREIQQESDQETDSKLQKIIDKSLMVINDRLENGELIFNSKTGKSERLPVRLRDAGQITKDMFQQQEKIRKKPELHEKEEAQADRLLKLAETFADFARSIQKGSKTHQEDIVEAELVEEDKNAFYEEREARLQEGKRALQLSPGTDSQTSTAEQSSG